MNKKFIRYLAGFLAVIMLLAIIAPLLTPVFAKDTWKNEVYGYGAALSEEEISSTADFLGIKNKNIDRIKIEGNDTLKYLGEASNDNEMISSVYIRENGKEEISVEVVTPLTIQKVSSLQYSNAAITAGLEGVDIKVASIRPVTGESALAGVYKALEQKGVEIDQEKAKNANEEIQVINVIADENKNEEGFSKEKLNEAVVEAKQILVEQKTESGQNVSAQEVRDVIQNVIKDNNLTQYVTNVNIDNLTVVLQNFINSNNIDLEKVKGQLTILASQAKDLAEKELNKLKDFLSTQEGKNFVNSLKDSVSKENLQKYLDGAKDAINSKEVENVLNGLKESLSTENLNNFLENAKDTLGLGNAENGESSTQTSSGGLLQAIGDFFGSIFKAIGEFFSNLF